MEKVVFVKAKFKQIGEMRVIKVPTGEKKKGIMGATTDIFREERQWVVTGTSNKEIDGESLAQDLQQAINALNKDGYTCVSVTQVLSGNYDHKVGGGDNWGNGAHAYGYGYSFTDGMIVVARKLG